MPDDRWPQLVRGIAAFEVPGGTAPPPTIVTDREWSALLGRTFSERLTGLAVESVAAGALAVTETQAGELLRVHREAMAWCLSVERKLVSLADSFDDEGIGFVVLKGASVAHAYYPEPCLRSFADLDLLVRTADYERACSLLGRLGHRRRRPEPRAGFEVRFGKASVHEHPDDGIEIDLHRTLVLGPFGLWIDPEELLDRRESFVLAGRKIGRLDDTGMLLNVAMHASLGWRPPKLVPLRDVLQVSLVGEPDWVTLERWAQRWQLRAVFQHAFRTAATTLNAQIPEAAEPLLAPVATKREGRALAAYTGEGRERGGTAIATLRAIPGLAAKAAYVGALAH